MERNENQFSGGRRYKNDDITVLLETISMCSCFLLLQGAS